MTFDTADLKDRAQQLLEAYNNGSWGSGFIDDPGELARVYDRFVDTPNPDDFGQHTSSLLSAMERLAPAGFDTNTSDSKGKPVNGYANSVLDKVIAVGIEVDDWTGAAADAFFKWSTEWKTSISNQFAGVSVLRELLHAEAAIWQAAAEDLDNISKAAIQALAAADDQYDTGSGDLEVTLKVVGAIVAVAGAAPTGGGSLAILPTLGAGVTVASTGMDIAKGATTETKAVRGCCPRDMLSSLKEGLKKIEDEIKKGEDALRKAIQANIDEIDENWALFCKPAPSLASTSRADIGAYGGLGKASVS